MKLLLSMLWALLLTELLELGFAWLWGLRRRQLLLVLLMNLLTNPAANLLHYLLTVLMGWPALPVILSIELAVLLTEGFCCRGMIPKPWLFAALVNGFSYGAGLLLQTIV